MLDVPEHAQAGHALHHARLLRVRLHELEVRLRHDVVEDVDLHAPIVLSTRAPQARWAPWEDAYNESDDCTGTDGSTAVARRAGGALSRAVRRPVLREYRGQDRDRFVGPDGDEPAGRALPRPPADQARR